METKPFSVTLVSSTNQAVFDRLIQSYECEFSAITKKLPLPDGSFNLDIRLGGAVMGFLAYTGEVPCGFNVVKCHPGGFEICEFFIIPVFRRQGLGYRLMESVCDRYRGKWEVKQIEDADSAQAFWKRAVEKYTNGCYDADVFDDPYWGTVKRQIFHSKF
jgi:predicted acetyltransferase